MFFFYGCIHASTMCMLLILFFLVGRIVILLLLSEKRKSVELLNSVLLFLMAVSQTHLVFLFFLHLESKTHLCNTYISLDLFMPWSLKQMHLKVNGRITPSLNAKVKNINELHRLIAIWLPAESRDRYPPPAQAAIKRQRWQLLPAPCHAQLETAHLAWVLLNAAAKY
jgi:hypothetical protein